MAQTELCSLRFAEVDWSDTGCLVTFGPLPQRLVLSIRTVGLLQQPLLQRREDGLLRIICGSRRLAACAELGLEPLPAAVLPSSIPAATCLRLAIYDNLAHRSLNPVEKALALTKMAPYVSQAELVDEFMPLLDLERSITVLDRYRTLAQLETGILEALAAGRLHERTAFVLSDLEVEDRLALFRLFEELPFSVSIQQSLVELLREIADRDRLSPAETLGAEDVRRLRQDRSKPQRRRAEELRSYLQARRAPRLTARRERFARQHRELGLPPGVRLVPPPYFEGPQWRLECTFQTPEELGARLKRVIQLATEPDFQQVMQS
jgi:ParB-like chromosome segregation protein Spo0J